MSDKIVHASVFSDRAIITRSVTLNADKGEGSYLFKDLPGHLVKESLRIKSSGGALIGDFDLKDEFRSVNIIGDAGKLKDELDGLKIKEFEINKQLELGGYVREFLNTFKIAGHEPDNLQNKKVLSISDYQNLFDLYKDKSDKNDIGKLKILKDLEELKNKIIKIQSDLDKYSSVSSITAVNCLVNFTCEKKSGITLLLSYIIHGAGWYPVYDARLDSGKRRLEITYSSQVYQNTQENWDDISLSFSTASPQTGAYLPDLAPWHINFYLPPPPSPAVRSMKAKKDSGKPMGGAMEEQFADEAEMASMSAVADMDNAKGSGSIDVSMINQSEVKSSGLNVTFDAKASYSVNSDGTAKKVILLIEEFPVNLKYVIIPHLSRNAYLKAVVLNDKEYPLLAGVVKVFYDNNFIGDSNVAFVSSREEFELFLGIDKSIDVKYQLLNKSQQKSGLTSQQNKIIFKYKITLTSYKEKEEEINLFEQIPISTEKDIKVRLEENSYFKDPDEKGVLKAVFTIKPKEKKEIYFTYTVEYPKDKFIGGI